MACSFVLADPDQSRYIQVNLASCNGKTGKKLQCKNFRNNLREANNPPMIHHPVSGMEISMAKGQLRSNREAKKPKQDKKPAPPVGGFMAPSKPDKPANSKS